MNNNRLFGLLFYLLRHRKAPAAELAEAFQVSVRTIYRDIHVLEQAGIPVYTSTGRSGGVCLMDSYVLDRMFITEQERQDMLSAIKSLEATQFMDTEQLLNKLGAVFKNETSDSIMVDFSNWGKPVSTEQKKFNLIKKMIEMKHCLEIRYVNSKGEERTRKIEPLKLLFKENAWFLFGFCREQEGFRLFRLSRIVQYAETKDRYYRAYDLDHYLAEAGKTFGPAIHLIITADACVKPRLYDVFDADVIKAQTDGSVRVETEIPDSEWVTSFLLSLGPAIKHIEPKHLRQRVAGQLKQALEHILPEGGNVS